MAKREVVSFPKRFDFKFNDTWLAKHRFDKKIKYIHIYKPIQILFIHIPPLDKQPLKLC